MKTFTRLALGIVAVLGLTVGTGAASAARPAAAPVYYLALGDSVQAGYQTPGIPTDRACAHAKLDSTGQRGYVCILWRHLRQAYPGIKLASLALAVSPGEDSCSFQSITNCEGVTSRTDAGLGDTPPFSINTVSQEAAAESFIAGHDVRVISFGIGGNDFLPLLGEAEQPGGLAKAEAQLPVVANRLATNLEKIVGALRLADPAAVFLLGDQYNPLSGLPPSALGSDGAAILKLASGALSSFQTGIRQIAAATHSQYVDEYDPFQGRALALTWITASQNIHPNAQGYLVLAQAYRAGFLDATAPLTVHVRAKHRVAPGSTQVFAIKTLPYASVTTAITYTVEGWSTVATRTNVAGIDGTLIQKWPVPAHARASSARSCAALNGHLSCTKTHFIIA